MKKFTLIIATLFVVFVSKSQDWIEFSASESTSPQYDVLTSNDTLVEFEINVPGMFSTQIDTFDRVQIKEHLRMDSIGFPELPIISYLTAIPDCDSVIVQIELFDSVKIGNINIYPAPELVPDTTEEGAVALVEQFVYNRDFYESDIWFPGKVIETVDKGAIRAQHVVRVLFYPVSFNPIKDEIWAYSEAKVTLSFINPSGSIHQNVGIFNEMLGNTLINYQSNGLNASVSCGAGTDTLDCEDFWVTSLPNQKIDDTCDYLIIAPSELFENDTLCSLANHRTSFNGFDVKIVTTDVIDTYITPSQALLKDKIFTLIRNTYFSENANNTYDNKLAYVNLFGDVEMESSLIGIPSFDDPVVPGDGGYDVVYTQLTYDVDTITQDTIYDIYPDLMIGRCSVDNDTQTYNVVHKILNFKPETLAWKDEMFTYIGVDSNFYPKESEVMFAMDDIIDEFYHKKLMIPPDFNQSYPVWDLIPYILPGDLTNLLNAYDSNMFINYMDHGGSHTWYGIFEYGSLNESHNHHLPFILSGACLTGAFHNTDDCMAERFTVYNSIRGAIAFVGSSIITSATTFSIISAYFESLMNNYSSVLGEAIMETKLENLSWRDCYNLFGDPALNILYENIDTLKPDLIIKASDITFTPDFCTVEDTIHIQAIIKNNSSINIFAPFQVGCYIGNPDEPGSVLIDSTVVTEISGYKSDTLIFNWTTSGYFPEYYDVYIKVDYYDSINELNENNNLNFNNKALYRFKDGFPVQTLSNGNSHPLGFNINANSEGEEIIFGNNIFTSTGTLLYSNQQVTKSFASIGNLNNNHEYQVIEQTLSDSLICFGDSLKNGIKSLCSRHRAELSF
ncbi:MAG: hypothetical protein K8R58_05775, partial [Bacteroidales bacterium]|nr:hypothetical protein [Bacteroidales bacterium]